MDIEKMITRVAEAAERPNAYAFLPEIKETLRAMLHATGSPQDKREQLARGLERYVLEDFSFSESELGGELLEFTEEFVAYQ